MTIPAPSALPGVDPPAAAVDEPLAMLHAAHDHVRRSLVLLREVGECVAAGRVDASVHAAAAHVLHYFDRAAPHHHEDEEQHIFPCVLAHSRDDTVRAAVMRLQEDHLAMEAHWAKLRVALAALANGSTDAYDGPQVAAAARFCALYEQHAQCEEQLVFPLAARLLDPATLQAAGAEMARRRAPRHP